MTIIMFLSISCQFSRVYRQIVLSKNSTMQEVVDPQPKTVISDEFDARFKPKGAIAFFILLVILGLIIWYGIYFLMLERI
jgi:hypothetical protein